MRKNSQQRLWLVCRKSGAVTEHLIRHNAGEDQSERELKNDAAGHFGNLETACRDRNGCAEHKRQVVLGQLAAHGVAHTCTGQRKRKRLRKRLLRCSI